MNKIERMKAVFAGGKADAVPAGFWFHYDGRLSPGEIAARHLELYRATDMDIVKVMQDYPYAPIFDVQTASDWYKVKMPGKNSPEFQKLEEVLKRILDEAGDEVMVFQTMFGPFKAAVMALGDGLVMRHAQEDPKAVAAGVNAIAGGLEEWAEGYMDAGASGIYYSAQFGEEGRFTRQAWETLVRPSDMKILGAAGRRQGKYNILHICGEPEYDFKVHLDWFSDYPGDLVNWSVKDTGVTLRAGRELFQRPVLGGMNNKGNLIGGTAGEIEAEAQAAIGEARPEGFMLGADCTVQGKIDLEKIRIAVGAAHGCKFPQER